MHHSTPSVALLLFARPAAQEAIRKPIVGVKRRDERIWRVLQSLAWSKIKATGLPAFLSYELIAQDTEESIGAQLRMAIQAVLDQGYCTVICLGAAYPGLRSADINAAAQLTLLTCDPTNEAAHCTLPMGVDRRGGVYLVGANEAVIQDTAAFEQLPWQSTQLAQGLSTYLHQRDQWVARLPATYGNWSHENDISLQEATGERNWLSALADALKQGAGPTPAAPAALRSSRTDATAEVRTKPGF